jgi:translin
MLMRAIPDAAKIERRLLSLQKKKDMVMDISREVVRIAGRSITLMHAGRMREANAEMRRLGGLAARLRKAEKGFEHLSMQAHQEYVEAIAFYTILNEGRIVSAAELRVGEIPYLLGMMDLTGELKREAIEAIMNNDIGSANEYYGFMKGIYDSTRGMRFADSLVPEFRRKQDTARIQLESTASELLGRNQ